MRRSFRGGRNNKRNKLKRSKQRPSAFETLEKRVLLASDLVTELQIGQGEIFEIAADEEPSINSVPAGDVSIEHQHDNDEDPTALTNDNFSTAVALWFSDESSATATYGHISNWDVSAVTDMSNAFEYRYSFNEDIGSWNVSNVTNMTDMFQGATAFNGNISSWDVSNVNMMRGMFANAEAFNQDISAWDVSNVTTMLSMFYGVNSLSDQNKCAIHNSFSSNGNWSYDWSELCASVVFATNYKWTSTESVEWHNSVNWSFVGEGDFPNHADHQASFGSGITESMTVATDQDVKVNKIEFDNADFTYNIAGTGNVTLVATEADPPINPTIHVVSGNHQFQVPMQLSNDTIVTTDSETKLTLNNSLKLDNNTLTKKGPGILSINNDLQTSSGELIINEGTVAGIGKFLGNVTNEGGNISPGDADAVIDSSNPLSINFAGSNFSSPSAQNLLSSDAASGQDEAQPRTRALASNNQLAASSQTPEENQQSVELIDRVFHDQVDWKINSSFALSPRTRLPSRHDKLGEDSILE